SVASGANHALSPADIDRAADRIRSADVVLLQLEVPLETVQIAAGLAAEAGVAVVLDPAPAPAAPLPSSLLKRIAYVKPNETEAEQLTGVRVQDEASARQAAERLLQMGVRNAIVTLGARGALWLGPGEAGFVVPYQVEAVDSTAAGDAFAG